MTDLRKAAEGQPGEPNENECVVAGAKYVAEDARDGGCSECDGCLGGPCEELPCCMAAHRKDGRDVVFRRAALPQPAEGQEPRSIADAPTLETAQPEPVNRRLLGAAKALRSVEFGHSEEDICAVRAEMDAAIAEAEAQPVGREPLDERKEAERVYSVTAFDYPANPIGSREWCLFWDGWRSRAELGITGEGV